MFTKKLTYTLLLSCLLACHANAQDSLLLRDYRFVKHENAWLTSTNAAALTTLAAPGITEAEAHLTKAKGGLVNYYDAPDVLQGGVSIESLYRLSQSTVVFGAISYDNYTGKDMTGSAFINPTRKPFDIAEDSLTNAGDKHRDTYRLTGGVGVDIWKGFSLGLSLDYTAANYAKYKDLRHKNKLMDMSVSAGAYAPLLPWLGLGANYSYHRNTESVSFSTYGKSEKVYKSLINYGAFFGTVEQFGNEGFTDKSREMPLFEDGHYGNIQLELRPTAELSAFGSIGFGKGKGYYGRQSPYTITYTRHTRQQRTATLSLRYAPQSRKSRHRLDATFSNEKLANRAETFRELTNTAGATYYEYFDPVETADKQWQDATLSYTAALGINGELPTWELHAEWLWSRRDQLNYLFPIYRLQRLTTNELGLAATYNLLVRHGVWTFSVNTAFRKGTGSPYEDGSFTPSHDTQHPSPNTQTAFLYREYQFLTAAQYHIGGRVKYAFRFPSTSLKTHVSLSIAHRKANETYDYSQGCDRTQGTIAIGCTF